MKSLKYRIIFRMLIILIGVYIVWLFVGSLSAMGKRSEFNPHTLEFRSRCEILAIPFEFPLYIGRYQLENHRVELLRKVIDPVDDIGTWHLVYHYNPIWRDGFGPGADLDKALQSLGSEDDMDRRFDWKQTISSAIILAREIGPKGYSFARINVWKNIV